MKSVYPIILTPSGSSYCVDVPDLDISTQGSSLEEAIFMARDAICAWACYAQDIGKTVPQPSTPSSVTVESPSIMTLVDVNFDAYRRRHNAKMVRRNVTLPGWMDELANEQGINVSQVLQTALERELQIV